MNHLLYLMCTISLLACSAEEESIKWKVAGEITDPAKGDPSLGFAGPVSGIYKDLLLIGGGANFPNGMPWLGGKKQYYASLQAFHIEDDILRPWPKTYSLPEAIAYPAVVTTPFGVVYVGGENDQGISQKGFLLKLSTDEDRLIVENLPLLPQPLTNAAASYFNNKVVVAGGDGVDSTSNQVYILHLDQLEKGWRVLPALPHPAANGVLLMALLGEQETLFYIGGRRRTDSGISDLFPQVYALDLQDSQWQTKAPLPYALSAGTGTTLNNHTLAIWGGDKGTWFHKTEQLIQQISSTNDTLKKEKLNQEKAALQTAHPGFSTEILLYDIQKNRWVQQGSLPFPTPVTTTAVHLDKRIFLPSGEIKAGVRSPKIWEARLP